MKRPRSLSLFRDVRAPVGEPDAGDAEVSPSPDVQPEPAETAPAEPVKRSRFRLPGRRPAAPADDVEEPESSEGDSAEQVAGSKPRRRLFGRGRRRQPEAEAGADTFFDPMDVTAGLAALAGEGDEVEFEIDEEGRLVEGGRKRYAIGLLWLPYDMDRSIAEQAGDAGFGDDAPDLYVSIGDREQIGFGYKYNGLRVGMPAAATLFNTEILPGNWLAAFEIAGEMGQSWWVVAWRDGQVYEDRVVTDPADAQSAFAALQEAPNWSAAICPVAWDIDGTVDYSLGSVLKKRGRPAKLRSTSRLRTLLPIAIPLALLVIAAVAGYLVWANIQEQARLERLRELEAERRRLAALRAAEPVEIIPPWEGMPSPERFYRICAEMFEERLIFPTGWRLQPQTCTVDGGNVVVQTSWTREGGGRLSWFLATLYEAGYEDVGVSDDLRQATIFARRPFGDGDLDRSITAFSSSEISERLRLRFDTLELNLRLRLVAPSGGRQNDPNAQPVWSYSEIRFTESTFLEEYLKLISDIPARVPERLTYDIYSQRWDMVIRLYHEARTDR
jgi:hypothetical protein